MFSSKRTVPASRPALLLALLVAPGLAASACAPGDPQGSEGETANETEATGEDPTADPGETTSQELVDAPTWYQDVAPIVVSRCGGCHRDGGIAPFALDSYEAAAPWATLLTAAVESGEMPPYGADETEECQPRFPFKHDARLPDGDKALLREWAEAEAPEGDPNAAATVPERPSIELTDADVTLTPKSGVEIEGTSDRFLCFVLDPQLEEDRYLAALQVVPGNDEIVHHVLVFTDENGSSEQAAGEDGWYECPGGGIQGDQLIAAWAPGAHPSLPPENAAFRLAAGSRLIVNIHYHPTGAGVEPDPGTALALKWYEGQPDNVSELFLIGNFEGYNLLPGPGDENGKEFRIPAGAAAHTEEMFYEVDGGIPEIKIWSVASHMHYVGVDMLLGIQRPDPGLLQPEKECLLQTPHYSFEWQRGYAYDAPFEQLPSFKAGDLLYFRCTYNNSMSNPYVVEALDERGLDAPVDVYLGDETLDEMCLGVFGIAYPRALIDP
ncbi:MAG: hypothetical protein H6713_14285 [Myxococcales bacterium]|nr:hypothetical protein [Myxococcales bacterium]MCB9751142.1 hypothetical protein [Myxococcales bacterium]